MGSCLQIAVAEMNRKHEIEESEIGRPTISSSVFLTRGTPLAGQESRRGSESAEP